MSNATEKNVQDNAGAVVVVDAPAKKNVLMYRDVFRQCEMSIAHVYNAAIVMCIAESKDKRTSRADVIARVELYCKQDDKVHAMFASRDYFDANGASVDKKFASRMSSHGAYLVRENYCRFEKGAIVLTENGAKLLALKDKTNDALAPKTGAVLSIVSSVETEKQRKAREKREAKLAAKNAAAPAKRKNAKKK